MSANVSAFQFGHIKYASDSVGGKCKVKIGDLILSVSALSGKWFTNIPIIAGQNFELIEGDPLKIILQKTNEKLFHPDQLAFDIKNEIRHHELEGESIFYSLLGNVINPKYVLITFSGISNFDNANYKLSSLSSVQKKLKNNALILAFQDREGVFGNYMYKTSSGYPIRAIVISLIMGLVAKFGIDKSRLIFYGNSKGGSVAIDYICYFPDAYFFIDIPQLDLFNYESQNDLMRYSIGVDARKYYNYLNYLPSINNRKVSYSFAENDFDASRGLSALSFPNININMLKDMGHSNSAMELVKRQFSKVIQIVNGVKPIHRPAISCVISIENEKLYFKRVLGGFNADQDRNKVYAEINFISDLVDRSISLNKVISDNGILVWWKNGFDFKKHLACGVYKINMVVYHEYKEFIYPLNKSLVVGDVSEVVNVDGA